MSTAQIQPHDKAKKQSNALEIVHWSNMSSYRHYDIVCLKPDKVTSAYNPEDEFACLLCAMSLKPALFFTAF